MAGRGKLLTCILISLFAIQTVNMNVTTIVPNFVAYKHDSLGELQVAFIMTAFEVAALLFSPIVGLMLEKLGRKNSIMIGFLVTTAATVGLACTEFIEDDQLYLYSSIAIRFV
jgi:MFS family permease